ncbi:sigma-70 family RNA polymerase sigma factor [Paenibacillus dokdonensis]|uniref:Sigma-70 family RNA polymerase sigma factor n=1 Tax=Paenibacillus dokdonensis TaxID=2567944 RepID=A0ABU6GNI6_9BACL|nr:sigma-70 family RNA polymerase sigma factor [Paenibacillus dokdonensis]MEC0240788.1 sigma-70 family RNA polymerase sigma factor [Paenibacillus dokdonensis]
MKGETRLGQSYVKKAQQGDRQAFVAAMRHVEGDLYSMARSILRSNEDCADAMQEAMLHAYKSLPSLREPAYFKTWLFRILINECNRIFSKQSRTLPIDPSVLEPSVNGGYDKIELREAVEHLDEPMRTVISLHYFRDMPIKEISSLLELSEGAVKTRLHRARKALVEALQYNGERKVEFQ